jgi:hypothetical protein
MNGFGLWPVFHAAEAALNRPGLNLPREAPQTWAWLCELTHHLEVQGDARAGGLDACLADPEHWQRAKMVALSMACGPNALSGNRAARIMAEHQHYATEQLRQRLPPEAMELPLGAHLRAVVNELGRTFLEELGGHLLSQEL